MNIFITKIKDLNKNKFLQVRLLQIVHLCKRILKAYPGSGRPSVPAFKVDPAIDVRNRQELGDAGMCHHFRLWLSQDTHGHGMSKKTSDRSFLEACLFRNLIKRDLATRRYHIRDFVAAYCVNTN